MTEPFRISWLTRVFGTGRKQVRHLDRFSLQHRAAGQRLAIDGQGFDVAHEVRGRPLRSQQAHRVAVGEVHRRHRRVAQLGGTLGDGLEHRLHVGRRARDHPQDFADRRLLLERFLRLVEQAHVLDRDRRLVGEGLHQRDLLVGEGPRFRTPEDDRADRAVFAHQRHRQMARNPNRSWCSRASGYVGSSSGTRSA